MKKIHLYSIITVAVVGTVGYFLLGNNNSRDVRYRTEKVTRGDVIVQVRATGTINPVHTVQVGSQVSGTVARLYADFNSVVKQGQVIAVIDSTFLYASVKEAEANLERNQAQVNEAMRSRTRVRELYKKELVSQADLDAAETAYESALAQLKQSQAAVDRARVSLRYSVIRAPIDGVVISRDVDVGQTVAASLQAPRLFVIANDLKNMQVEASVDEADIGQIREGEEATFSVDAYPDEQFRGSVTQVRLSPVIVQNVVTYTVIIEVPNPDMKLRPGMTATVSVLIERHESVLRIPTLALRFQPPPEVMEKTRKESLNSVHAPTPDGGGKDKTVAADDRGKEQMRGKEERSRGSRWRDRSEGSVKMSSVWVLENGKNLKPISVQVGLNDNRYVEVMGDDLKEGDEIVIGSLASETPAAGQQTNPFAPRMPGGPPRTRGM